MTWRDKLLSGSFRGVPFDIVEHGATVGGRRAQVHEYPGRDVPWAEDLGAVASKFEVRCRVIGDDYMAKRDRLVEACRRAGPGALMHPYLGVLNVLCTGCQVTERGDQGRMAEFTLQFTAAGRHVEPAAVVDTAYEVEREVGLARAAMISRFAGSFR